MILKNKLKLLSNLKASGSKSVTEILIMTPAANAKDEINIFSLLLKNIKKLPIIVDRPAKVVKINAKTTLFIRSPI